MKFVAWDENKDYLGELDVGYEVDDYGEPTRYIATIITTLGSEFNKVIPREFWDYLTYFEVGYGGVIDDFDLKVNLFYTPSKLKYVIRTF